MTDDELLMLARAFEAADSSFRIILVLFAFNALGYFVGGWVEGAASHWTEFPLVGITLQALD